MRMSLASLILLGWGQAARAGVETSFYADVQAEKVDVSTRVEGVVKRVLVKDGTVVERGAPLLELDDTDLRARVMSAEAELAARRAELVSKLPAHADRPHKRLDRALARATLDVAGGRVKLAEAALLIARLDVPRATLRAEIGGTFRLSRQGGVLPGALVRKEQTLGTITDLDHAWVKACFEESQIAHIEIGQHADVAIGEMALRGTVDSIDLDAARLVRAFIDMERDAGGPRSRVAVCAKIGFPDRHVPLVPGSSARVEMDALPDASGRQRK